MDSKRLTPRELELLNATVKAYAKPLIDEIDEELRASPLLRRLNYAPVSILPPDFIQTPYVPKEAK